MKGVVFFLLKEAHFYLCSLHVISRCASRGISQHKEKGKHHLSAEQHSFQVQLIALQPQLIAKAMKDEAFRQHLLEDPKQILEHTLGVTIPQGVTIKIHEQTSTTSHLLLPMKALTGELQELSDEELK